MARVTIEDCLEKVDDRFELVALASQRAKEISSGGKLTIERKGEKDTVISLREIAEGTIKIDDLRKGIVASFQKHRDTIDDFIAPASVNDNPNSDEFNIDQEEADIRAAMAEASEEGLNNETDESLEGLTEEEVDIEADLSDDEFEDKI
ncbi:MAG TPA: DNA-directed RNA polymerase subunit omega [Alphaproteobacteria bacterium]|nr:DNA-directed RNA polymerase subunit omega [Alphaproteobacteria bacterium]